MSDYELERICKDLSHQCITSIVPDEASFFEPIWQVLHKQIFQSKNVLSPKSWWEKSTYTETLSGLGLYGGEDLRTVSIISTLSALMITMLSSEKRTMDRLDILVLCL